MAEATAESNHTVEPYCEHAECHDTATAYYATTEWWTGTTSLAQRHPTRSTLVWFQKPEPWEAGGIETHRLCVIHARERHGISMGGRIHG